MDDMLLVEDLMLLLLDDGSGAIAGAGTLHYTLGGAVLVELALLGRAESDGKGGLGGPTVRAVGDGPLPDPLLQEAFDALAEKPRRVQSALLLLGAELRKPLLQRLVDRGLIREERRRILGLIPTTARPAADATHEAGLRRDIEAVLVDGADPSPRTAALIAMVSASGAIYEIRPMLPHSTAALARAKEMEEGEWGAQAVGTAVALTAAGIAVATATAVATTVIATN